MKKRCLSFITVIVLIFGLTTSISMKAVKADNDISVSYTTHVQKEGWQNYVSNGELSGTTGKSLRLEGIKIKVEGDSNLGIDYSTYVQRIGWQSYVSNGELSGTTGKALRLEAIKMKLTGSDADKYDIYYRVQVQHYGWLDWAKNDAISGTTGLARRLEAIEIKVLPKDTSTATVNELSTMKTDIPYIDTANISYSTHVQKIGWQDSKSNGDIAGTVGKALRLEGIKINSNSNVLKGSISYKTHVQKLGWQDWVSNNALSGTEGKALRLEAIQIKLNDDYAKYYDIYYRTQVQHFGWLGWAKNGQTSGTTGYGYRMEAIQIKLVAKDDSAPGSTSDYYKEKLKQYSFNEIENTLPSQGWIKVVSTDYKCYDYYENNKCIGGFNLSNNNLEIGILGYSDNFYNSVCNILKMAIPTGYQRAISILNQDRSGTFQSDGRTVKITYYGNNQITVDIQ